MKVIMTCGKPCSGKTTYAKAYREQHNAVLLSADELMLSLFGNDAGEKHDEYVEKIKAYLLRKSVELVPCGVNVVLDWGLWTKAERSAVREFYHRNGISCEIHYLDIDDETWRKRIMARNTAIFAGKSDDYYVDDALVAKFESIFEEPDKNEVDFWMAQEKK